MKVVINRRFGGFGLSEAAKTAYAHRKGLDSCPYAGDIPREDPDLVAVVEALGEQADDRFSRLAVVEIPDGIAWEISEYDGREHIAEKHRTWG